MSKYQFSCEVTPQYLPEQSAPEEHIYGFSYTVTVTNTGEVTAQLISRHWIISDANGHNEEVKGLGVVGHQPLLKPGESFPVQQRLAPAHAHRHHAWQLFLRGRRRRAL
jgi:ApaG protein